MAIHSFNLLDVALLHEMTHTSGGGMTDDVRELVILILLNMLTR